MLTDLARNRAPYRTFSSFMTPAVTTASDADVSRTDRAVSGRGFANRIITLGVGSELAAWRRNCFFMDADDWTFDEKPYDLRERLFNFACAITRLAQFLHMTR